MEGISSTLQATMKKNLVIILKNPGTTCNIGCVYCAEERKKFVSIDKTISEEQIKRIAEMSKDYSLNVLFHGGEPTLLSCDYYQEAMDIFQLANKDVFFGLQTNATLIDDVWIEFLIRNKKRLGISVSLDGPNEVNKYRVTKDKNETYETVASNVKKLSEAGIKTGMICTIVSTSLGKEQELYNMLKSFDNLQFVKLNPCMDRNKDGTVPFWGVTPTQYFEFVSGFFDIMVRESAWDKFFIEPIISVLKNLQGVRSSFCNYSNDKCTNFISIYPDGTVTSCDNFNLQDGYIGSLESIDSFSDVVTFQKNENLAKNYASTLKMCDGCSYHNVCKGGCVAARIRYMDTDEYCIGMKSMIDHIREVYDSVR